MFKEVAKKWIYLILKSYKEREIENIKLIDNILIFKIVSL